MFVLFIEKKGYEFKDIIKNFMIYLWNSYSFKDSQSAMLIIDGVLKKVTTTIQNVINTCTD